MIEVTLKQIKAWISCEIDEKYLDHTIKGVTIDSRKIDEGNLFIPFKGCLLYTSPSPRDRG